MASFRDYLWLGIEDCPWMQVTWSQRCSSLKIPASKCYLCNYFQTPVDNYVLHQSVIPLYIQVCHCCMCIPGLLGALFWKSLATWGYKVLLETMHKCIFFSIQVLRFAWWGSILTNIGPTWCGDNPPISNQFHTFLKVIS